MNTTDARVGGMACKEEGGRPRSVGFDLRKTARGASSPAKPALHIPELHQASVNHLSHCRLVSLLLDRGCPRK